MKQTSAGPEAGLFSDKFRYERHRPERTLLYQLVAPVSEQRLSLTRNGKRRIAFQRKACLFK